MKYNRIRSHADKNRVLLLFLIIILLLSDLGCRKDTITNEEIFSAKDYIGNWNFIVVTSNYSHTPWGNKLDSHDSVSYNGNISLGETPDQLIINAGSVITGILSDNGKMGCYTDNYHGSGQFEKDYLVNLGLGHYSNAYGAFITIYGENPHKTQGIKNVPTVVTDSATLASFSSVTLNGKVKANCLFTDIFFEYGTSTSYGYSAKAESNLFSGEKEVLITTSLTGLTPYQTYHYRIKAINSLGTSYGKDMKFETISPTINDIDGNIYRTIKIGTQTWMAENLKTTRYSDGTPIQLVMTDAKWDNLPISEKAYCFYKDDTANFRIYGALYNWPAAVNGETGSAKIPSGIQGVCPTGWHIPSEDEWNVIEAYLGGQEIAGGKMTNLGGTNTSGFTALPGMARSVSHSMWAMAKANFWTSTEYPTNNEIYYRLIGVGTTLSSSHRNKGDGLSVRCLKN